MWVYNNRERQESDGYNGLTLTQAMPPRLLWLSKDSENVGRNK